MSDPQAKLMAALRKKAEDAEAPPPPLAPIAPQPDRDTLKLRTSSLRGVTTWEEAMAKVAVSPKHDVAEMHATLTKMLGNVIANPSEPKYRKIRHSNPNFVAKVYSCSGAAEVLQLAGFKKDSIEDGFLVLPESADIALLQRALDALQAHAQERAASEEKKRKHDAEQARIAREARAQKAQEAQEPASYDAAVAASSSQMVDEDEAMIEAIEAYMAAHPESGKDPQSGRPFDAYDIERQVAGPGGLVVATVAASAGTSYTDLAVTMKRGDNGAWSVSKVATA